MSKEVQICQKFSFNVGRANDSVLPMISVEIIRFGILFFTET